MESITLRMRSAGRRGAAALVDAVYPPRCVVCETRTEASHGLCPACWAGTGFIAGLACTRCGLALPGATSTAEGELVCDGCIAHPPAWDRGRCAVSYEGGGRKAVLALKHGDRLDLAPVLAGWLNRVGPALIAEADIVAPVPLYWTRLFRRRFNQSAEIARHLARPKGALLIPGLVTRIRNTGSQDGLSREARHANLVGAFRVAPRWRPALAGRRVLLVDDVMTSGATLSAVASACRDAGAAAVDVLAVARVAMH